MRTLVIMLCALLCPSVMTAQTRRGDLNGDGQVNITDVVELINIIANGVEPLPETDAYIVKGVKFKMIAVEGGTFNMGTLKSNADEKPVHSVTLNSFYIGQTEVTQELWEAVMDSNPSNFQGATLPVERVSWEDCQQFITKLNAVTGKKFRLPTEAEWEFAARGGLQSKNYIYSGNDVIDNAAWYYINSYNQTHDVGQKMPNELDIYDMSGNVSEWCQDWYDPNYYSLSEENENNPTGPATGEQRVGRGGNWMTEASSCRCFCREAYLPSTKGWALGLRLALDASK